MAANKPPPMVSSARPSIPRPASKSSSKERKPVQTNVRQESNERRSASRTSSPGDLMVEVGNDEDDMKVPGEDDEPDMDYG